MPGLIYTAVFEEVSVSATSDLFEILAPSDAVMCLHQVVISQSSEESDAEAEMLPFQIKRVTGSPTSGSGGSSVTPNALTQGAPAAGCTVEANNTTVLTGGTQTTLWVEDVNIMVGWNYFPTPETRMYFSPSTYCVIGLEASPTDAITMSGVVVFEEIGG